MSLTNWTSRDRPGQVGLQGRTVRLEPLRSDAHYAALYPVIASPEQAELWTYMPLGPFPTLKAFTQALQHCRATLGWELMVISPPDTPDIALGMAGYMRIREAHGSAEVGCVTFSPALQRTIQATEAMYLMAAHVFDDLGYRRYEWKCHNDNAASRRAAARFGFQFEGVFRQDMVVKGENRDTAWFAMTDQDWPHLKRGFEAWLAPGNFDPNGQQIRSLEACRQ